jgi:hypothetical protein
VLCCISDESIVIISCDATRTILIWSGYNESINAVAYIEYLTHTSALSSSAFVLESVTDE